jgi:methyl-accepting chemotaxis protein
VSEISQKVGEIAVSAREQSSGLGEINAAVNQLDQVTQQNAAMFEETTAASHALTAEAEALNKTMGLFNIGEQTTPATNAENVVSADAFASKRSAEKTAETRRETAPAPSVETSSSAAVKVQPMPEPSIDDDWDDF